MFRIYSWLCLGISLASAQGTVWSAGDWAWVGCRQNWCPVRCTILRALKSFSSPSVFLLVFRFLLFDIVILLDTKCQIWVCGCSLYVWESRAYIVCWWHLYKVIVSCSSVCTWNVILENLKNVFDDCPGGRAILLHLKMDAGETSGPPQQYSGTSGVTCGDTRDYVGFSCQQDITLTHVLSLILLFVCLFLPL